METVAARDYGHQGIPSVVIAYVKGQKPTVITNSYAVGAQLHATCKHQLVLALLKLWSVVWFLAFDVDFSSTHK